MPLFGKMIKLKNGNYKKLILDLKNYINPVSEKKEIFTREDISKMNSETFEQNEKKIIMQMNSIGIPTNEDLSYCDTIDFSNHPYSGWIWVLDDTVANHCDFCLDMEGKIFANKKNAPGIPVHTNCKCDLLKYVLV